MTTDYVPFADDTEASVYGELKSYETQIMSSAEETRQAGRKAVQAKALYDGYKNAELARLFVEEAASVGVDEKGKKVQLLKRVESERESIYRTKYATERLAWTLAEREYEVCKDYLKSLQAVLMSTQTRARMIKQDYEIS